MTGAPTWVDNDLLAELGIELGPAALERRED
jgi:hypothetical protein